MSRKHNINYSSFAKVEEAPVVDVEVADEPSIADADIPEEVMETVVEHVEEDHHDDFLTGEPLQVSTPVSKSNMVKCNPSCDLNFRMEADKNSAIIRVLHPQDVIEVEWFDNNDAWVAAVTADGVEGFVMKQFLDKI